MNDEGRISRIYEGSGLMQSGHIRNCYYFSLTRPSITVPPAHASQFARWGLAWHDELYLKCRCNLADVTRGRSPSNFCRRRSLVSKSLTSLRSCRIWRHNLIKVKNNLDLNPSRRRVGLNAKVNPQQSPHHVWFGVGVDPTDPLHGHVDRCRPNPKQQKGRGAERFALFHPNLE